MVEATPNDALLNACRVLSSCVGVQHTFFYVMESEKWRQVGVKIFRVKEDKVNTTAPLAANQGAYNLLVGIALIFSSLPWGSMFPDDSSWAVAKVVYESFAAAGRWLFTALVYSVGVYGWQSLGSPTIMKFQGGPGLIVMILNILYAHSIGTGANVFEGLQKIGIVMLFLWTTVGALCGVRAAQWKVSNKSAADILEQKLLETK